MKKIFSYFLIFASGCVNIEPQQKCPLFENIPLSPFDNPIWNHSRKVIGFNHSPIRHIIYKYGYDCPKQAEYNYATDSTGFWIINVDGTGKRRIFPKKLLTPSWSPDGKWIAFSKSGQIFKMPFDGQNFDTTNVVAITSEGRNFYPAWSPNGEKIAFHNTVCGSATEPIPPNSCGVLIIKNDGTDSNFIPHSGHPYWSLTDSVLYIDGTEFNLTNGIKTVEFDLSLLNIATFKVPKFDPEGNAIAFIGTLQSGGFEKLFILDPVNKTYKIPSIEGIIDFSWVLTENLFM